MKPTSLHKFLLPLFFLPLAGHSANLVGLWEFDDPNDLGKATVGTDLVVAGTAPTHSVSLVDDTANTLNGVISTVAGGANYLDLTHNIGRNGGGNYTNQYTFVYDVKRPTNAAWRAFYQTNVNNTNDAEYYVRGAGGVLNSLGRASGGPGYSTKAMPAETWVRLAISVDLQAGRFQTFIDGVLFQTHTAPSRDGGYALEVDRVLFFADDNGENERLDVGAVAIYDAALTATEASALGIPGDPFSLPTPEDLLWTGAASGEWSTAAIGGAKNWVLASSLTTKSDFEDYDSVTFDDIVSPILETTVEIVGDVRPVETIFYNDMAPIELTGSGSIIGLGDMTVAGSGGLRIENTNTFTGKTTQSYGALVLANENALQNSNLITSSGEPLTFEGVSAIRLGGLSGYADIPLKNEVGEPLTLTVGSGGGSGNHGGEISGDGAIVKMGVGSQTFAFSNSYTGGTTVVGGPDQNGSANTPGALAIGASNALGTGPLVFETTTSTSLLRIVADQVELPNEISLPTAPGIINEFTTNQSLTGTLSGKISGGDATSSLMLDSSTSGANSVLRLTNSANDFTVSAVTMWRGTLAITSDGVLGNPNNDIELFTESVNGSLRFDADHITINPNREIRFYDGVGAAPINTQEFTGTIEGNFIGSGTLVKQGIGKLILTGINSSPGRTDVLAGTLQVDGTFEAGSLEVAVKPDGTLAGNGKINRSVILEGTLSPGATVGTLTTDSLTLAAGSTYAWEISNWTGAAGTGYDTTVASSLTINATDAEPVTVVVKPESLANFANSNASFTLVSTTAGLTGFAADAFVVDASALPAATGTWKVEQVGNDLKLVFTQGSASPFQVWAQGNITGINPLAPAGFEDDADGDGLANGLEWILGGNPLAQDAASLMTTTATASGGLVLTFTRDPGSIGHGSLAVEWDTGLAAGFTHTVPITNAIAPNGNNPTVAIDTGVTPHAVTVKIPAANAGNGKIFARLRAELP